MGGAFNNVTRGCWIDFMCTYLDSCFLFLSRLILHSVMMAMTIISIAAPMIARATIISKAR